jgi:hypothetical protein
MNGLYKTEVNIQYGQLEEMIAWCKANCLGLWGYYVVNAAGEEPGQYSFQFESEKDYVTFLVWRQ